MPNVHLHSIVRDVYDPTEGAIKVYSGGGSGGSAYHMHSILQKVYDGDNSAIRVNLLNPVSVPEDLLDITIDSKAFDPWTELSDGAIIRYRTAQDKWGYYVIPFDTVGESTLQLTSTFSLDVGGGDFVVDANGNVTIKDGSTVDGVDVSLKDAASLQGVSINDPISQVTNAVLYYDQPSNTVKSGFGSLILGGDDSSHYHTSDRARANHTGTQAISTITDYLEQIQDIVGGMLGGTETGISVSYDDVEGAIDFVVAYGEAGSTACEGNDGRLLSSVQKTDLTDSGDCTIHYHATDRARANHTGTQALSTIANYLEEIQDIVGAMIGTQTGIVVTYQDGPGTMNYAVQYGIIANTACVGNDVRLLTEIHKQDLTDAGDCTIHYHASDRARANHTGTQTAATISDFDTEVSNNTDVAANTAARHTHYRFFGYVSSNIATNGTTWVDITIDSITKSGFTHTNGSAEITVSNTDYYMLSASITTDFDASTGEQKVKWMYDSGGGYALLGYSERWYESQRVGGSKKSMITTIGPIQLTSGWKVKVQCALTAADAGSSYLADMSTVSIWKA